jgi:hypothetical protein
MLLLALFPALSTFATATSVARWTFKRRLASFLATRLVSLPTPQQPEFVSTAVLLPVREP